LLFFDGLVKGKEINEREICEGKDDDAAWRRSFISWLNEFSIRAGRFDESGKVIKEKARRDYVGVVEQEETGED
jgi:5S rRNA maturation endonuclease (ribonuclease M5)